MKESKKAGNNLENPFKDRNPEDVWKELLKNSKSITREEAAKRMKKASQKQ